ncbi:MAG: zinc-ribbon domain-containing protein [Clostridia bacterium]|nr:zinc-ribbon domain-containing protein [Clostridia bacterium]
MFCKSCGNKIEEGALFCDNCGFAVNLQQNTEFSPKLPKNSNSLKLKFIILGLSLVLVVLVLTFYFILKPAPKKEYKQDSPEGVISEFENAINSGNVEKARLLFFDKYAADELEYMSKKRSYLSPDVDAGDVISLSEIQTGDISDYLEYAYSKYGDDFYVKIDIIDEENVDYDTKSDIYEELFRIGVEPEDICMFECEVTKKGSLDFDMSVIEIYCYELYDKWYIYCMEYHDIYEIFHN